MHIQIPIFSSTISGGQRITFQHAKYLQELGCHVEILMYSSEVEVQFPFVDNLNIIKVGKKGGFYFFNHALKIFYLSKCIKSNSIVLCNSWQAALIALISSVSRRKIVYLIQHDDEIIDSGRPFFKRFINRQLYLLIYKSKLTNITVSSWLQKRFKEKYNVDSFLIKNGIIPENFDSNLSIKKNKDEYKILVFARKPKWKGFDCVINALNILISEGFLFKLVIASNEEIEVPDNIPFEKVIPKSDVELGLLFRSSDLFVFPSYSEGFGLPPLEAMSCGIPVVCSNCGGVNDFAFDGYNCEMFEPGDFKELARKIFYLYENKDRANIYINNGILTANSFHMKDASNQLYLFLKNIQ